MLYVYLLIVVIAVGFVLWKMSQTPKGPTPTAPRRDVPRGPDDDPDFLRKL
ncbi:hypothetical protein [Gordonia caeni]|uniref:Uncharacterized protein n=1 Tax=Gordonia caeni TaxID=1007097 RepID=A0ABP7NPX2_9ACTN